MMDVRILRCARVPSRTVLRSGKMEKTIEVDLKELLFACLRRLWLILLSTVVAAVLVYIYTACFVTPMYKTEATFYVNNSVVSEDSQKISSSDLATAQKLVLTCVNIIKSDTVLEKVAAEADLDMTATQLRSVITASDIDETEMFKVQVEHEDPVMAAKIANAIADVAPQEISNIIVGSTTKVVDRAKIPTSPYSPNRATNTVLGALVGLVASVAVVVISTLMDVRIKTEDDLTAICEIPVLGVIPDFSEDAKSSGFAANKNENGRR